MDTKTILITGAGSGIGLATGRAFLDAGWNVAFAGRRKAALVDAAQGHPCATILPMDVADAGSVQTGFETLAQTWGRLDVLFNNAGRAAKAAPIDEIPVEEWLDLSATNITGMFLCARAAFGMMRRQAPQGGRIINNGSISAHAPRPGSAPYTMSKHAVTGLTKTLALDGRRFGISCGQIDIGNAASAMTAAFTKGTAQADGSLMVEPVMDVAHVAKAVLHMANLPPEANIPFMTIMARDMPFIGRG